MAETILFQLVDPSDSQRAMSCNAKTRARIGNTIVMYHNFDTFISFILHLGTINMLNLRELRNAYRFSLSFTFALILF